MWVARVDPEQDHHRVTGSSLRPPSHWRRPCGRPRISWLRAIDTDVAYSQSTSGSTQPGERPVTARSGDVSSTRQHSIMGHAATEERKMHITGTARPNFAPNFVHAIFLVALQYGVLPVLWMTSGTGDAQKATRDSQWLSTDWGQSLMSTVALSLILGIMILYDIIMTSWSSHHREG